MERQDIFQTRAAVEAGLVVEINGEIHLTAAGLFALAGRAAFSFDIEPACQKHNLLAISRVFRSAREAGLDPVCERTIRWAFSENVNPVDGTPEGEALAKLCRHVAALVDPVRMPSLVSGERLH